MCESRGVGFPIPDLYLFHFLSHHPFPSLPGFFTFRYPFLETGEEGGRVKVVSFLLRATHDRVLFSLMCQYEHLWERAGGLEVDMGV